MKDQELAFEIYKKNKKDLQGFYKFRTINSIIDIIRRIGLWFPILLLAYWIKTDLGFFAGKSTSFNIFIKYLSDPNVFEIILYALTAFSIIWGFIERKLRYQKTSELTARIQELEKKLDPRRTSSKLKKSGKTNTGD